MWNNWYRFAEKCKGGTLWTKKLDLSKESIKILGVHISYNKKPQDDTNFSKTFKNICNVIKLWCMRHLSLEGKTTLHKKCNFLWKISSVIVTKSAVSCGFGHIYWRNAWWKCSFLCSVYGPVLNFQYFEEAVAGKGYVKKYS